jgi:hypothetical protein
MMSTTLSQNTSDRSVSLPRALLHLEGLVVLIVSIACYAQFTSRGWGFFALLLFMPDAVMLIYLLNKRAGIIAYNVVHTYSLPVLLTLIALIVNAQTLIAIGLIWCAHIAMDRAVGYGLKYNAEFKATHLRLL